MSKRFVPALAVISLLLSVALLWCEFTPMAMLADTRLAALVSGLAATFLSLWVLRGRKEGARSVVWTVMPLASVASVIAAAVLLFVVYHEEDVRFRNGDIELSGTVFRPREAGAYPAIIFIHGSGREERNVFAYQAKLFARHGFVSLVYDKRGAGASSGNTFSTDYAGYAADAAAAISFLRTREDVNRACVGILGHSEGGWVGSIVASRLHPDVAFLIVTSNTPLSPAQQVLYETGATLRSAGYSDDVVNEATRLQSRVLQFQRTGVADGKLAEDLQGARPKPWFSVAELPEELYPISEYAWWRGVMDFDALSHWRDVRAPVLAISGGRDRNSDVRSGQAAIKNALATAGNHDFTGRVFPEMEHGGVEWWLPFRLPPPRFPQGYAELLITWTQNKTARCPKR